MVTYASAAVHEVAQQLSPPVPMMHTNHNALCSRYGPLCIQVMRVRASTASHTLFITIAFAHDLCEQHPQRGTRKSVVTNATASVCRQSSRWKTYHNSPHHGILHFVARRHGSGVPCNMQEHIYVHVALSGGYVGRHTQPLDTTLAHCSLAGLARPPNHQCPHTTWGAGQARWGTLRVLDGTLLCLCAQRCRF